MNLNKDLQEQIIDLAQTYHVKKIVLFGSRARGDCHPRSDIDLAISGGDIAGFCTDIDEVVRTLLMFDVVNLDGPVQEELLESIEAEGIVIYEEI